MWIFAYDQHGLGLRVFSIDISPKKHFSWILWSAGCGIPVSATPNSYASQFIKYNWKITATNYYMKIVGLRVQAYFPETSACLVLHSLQLCSLLCICILMCPVGLMGQIFKGYSAFVTAIHSEETCRTSAPVLWLCEVDGYRSSCMMLCLRDEN